jgi:hypothetical protein
MDELIASESKPEAKSEAKVEAKSDAKQASKTAIVWTGLAERLYEVPVPPGNFSLKFFPQRSEFPL